MRRVWIAGLLTLVAPAAHTAVSCSYTVSPILDFGTVNGLPTPQIDVTANISVTCTNTGVLSLNQRVCLSIPEGTGGNTIADRRLVTPGHFVQYQLYRDSGHTQIWGAYQGSSPPQTVDFPVLLPGIPVTQNVTIYGRVFGGQTGKSVGTYQSDLVPIVARRDGYLLGSPACTQITANPTTLPTLPVQLVIEPSCTIVANDLDFGTVTGLTGHTATSNLSVHCTENAAYSVALDGGAVTGDVNDRRMQLGPGPDTIGYQLYQDSSHTQFWGETSGTMVTGTGTGGPQSIPIFGLVPAQGPKPPGDYEDTITATVIY